MVKRVSAIRSALVLALGLVVGVLTTPARSQQSKERENPRPCSETEHRQFDFWLGDWTITWPTPDGATGHAVSRVERVLDGCVILENFRSLDPAGDGLVGKSVSAYNERLGVWQQTWVDNHGNYMDFVGRSADGKMTLELADTRPTPDGYEARWRMIFYNITASSMDWSWQRSLDDGATWEEVWPLHYVRRTSANGS